MKFGLALSVQHPPEDSQAARFREHLEQVRLARAVEFDSVWASQHYLAAPFTYFQPIPTLARIAAEAQGMWLGTGCLLLPLHHPVEVAEQIATLDVIAEGRFIFGVGLGYRDVENEAVGQKPGERVRRRISMLPLQRPRPPIWLAGNSDAGVRRAARLGDAWLMNPHATLPTLERQLGLFHETRRQLGRPPAQEIPVTKECYVAPDAATAFREARPYLEAKYRAYRAWEQDKALPAGESWSDAFEELARDRFLIGDPVRVREEIARYRERLGVTTITFRLQWPGMEQEKVLRSIRLLGEQVFPHLM
jgi:alkanesulfonate monooxygenase SsuD/methylene tetrahydromethanopterin reductase-like flavin-dependent oxidoreductase (luciferase family)